MAICGQAYPRVMRPTPGTLLVADPNLHDSNFVHTVVYLLEHSDTGSLGLIVNRPLTMTLGDLWQEVPPALAGAATAAEGGPVERDKGLLLHGDTALIGARSVGDGLALGGELGAIGRRWAAGADHAGPRLFLGHSGWGAGQLEQELRHGSWRLRPGHPGMVLRPVVHDLWERLLAGGLPQPSVN